jgi:hypothetical protein
MVNRRGFLCGLCHGYITRAVSCRTEVVEAWSSASTVAPASRRTRRRGKSQIWDSKICSRAPRDSDPRKTALARTNSIYKRQACPLVREGAPQKQTRNCKTVINTYLLMNPRWDSTPRVTDWLTDWLTDYQSQCYFDFSGSRSRLPTEACERLSLPQVIKTITVSTYVYLNWKSRL